MASSSIEDRVAAVEIELAKLKQQLNSEHRSQSAPWWERHSGAFQDDPNFDEAMRLASEYRKSQPTAADGHVARSEAYETEPLELGDLE